MHQDSIDKICSRYFATVTKVPFDYQGKRYEPKVLKVSPLLLRDYTCPPGCGGCCFRFTLDYLPSEKQPAGTAKRMVEFNGRSVEIWTDPQTEGDNRCGHLNRQDGRCGIYKVRPFTCDFELIRSLQNDDPDRPNVLTQKLFGRGWSYPRTDGGKGALCEMTPVTDKSISEVVRKLKRLLAWTTHFRLDTWVPELLVAVEKGYLKSKPIAFDPKQDGVCFGL